ncbi:hypothetical protein NQ317_016087 [Molorchus minor]|uniref:Uncharacterized protein n=1 Tax=Molorchus minor TaxID=1323400 RepID=A0ABQ9IWN8_9CUCU|nr:hypothetical protein NQ317_016087 [Molorchus minor]
MPKKAALKEAADLSEESRTQHSRQFLFNGTTLPGPPFAPQNWNRTVPSSIAMTGPCFTRRCISLRQCYPLFKIPGDNKLEGRLWGMYETCTYFTPQGRQFLIFPLSLFKIINISHA